MKPLKSHEEKRKSSSLPPVRVPPGMLKAIKKQAKKAGTSTSDAIRQVLEQWLEAADKRHNK